MIRQAVSARELAAMVCSLTFNDQVHGRPSRLTAAISDSDRTGARERRSNIRRMASWRCFRYLARSTASRIRSMMTVFSSCPGIIAHWGRLTRWKFVCPYFMKKIGTSVPVLFAKKEDSR